MTETITHDFTCECQKEHQVFAFEDGDRFECPCGLLWTVTHRVDEKDNDVWTFKMGLAELKDFDV